MGSNNATFIHNIKALILLEPFIVLFVLKKFVPSLDDVLVYAVFGALLFGSVVSVIILTRLGNKQQ